MATECGEPGSTVALNSPHSMNMGVAKSERVCAHLLVEQHVIPRPPPGAQAVSYKNENTISRATIELQHGRGLSPRCRLVRNRRPERNQAPDALAAVSHFIRSPAFWFPAVVDELQEALAVRRLRSRSMGQSRLHEHVSCPLNNLRTARSAANIDALRAAAAAAAALARSASNDPHTEEQADSWRHLVIAPSPRASSCYLFPSLDNVP